VEIKKDAISIEPRILSLVAARRVDGRARRRDVRSRATIARAAVRDAVARVATRRGVARGRRARRRARRRRHTTLSRWRLFCFNAHTYDLLFYYSDMWCMCK